MPKKYTKKAENRWFSNSSKILEKCAAILEDRNSEYGFSGFEDVAKVASLIKGVEVTSVDIAILMLSVKIARASASIKADKMLDGDNVMDLINYTLLLDREMRLNDKSNKVPNKKR